MMIDESYVEGLISDGQLDFAKSLVIATDSRFSNSARTRLLRRIDEANRSNQVASSPGHALAAYERSVGELVDLRACCD